jgi:hypothetical protein
MRIDGLWLCTASSVSAIILNAAIILLLLKLPWGWNSVCPLPDGPLALSVSVFFL